jgi:dTDP-4-dehydrorhamnose 3,5-epimerase
VIFSETALKGSYLITLEKKCDERGFFARSWCEKEFAAYNLMTRTVQCNVSFNKTKGILRGLHYQAAPFQEAKLIRCTQGSIYDVVVDLRPESPSFRRHIGEILTSREHKMLYVPEGFAHGFQTLEDGTEVFYQMSQFYSPEHARGIRWNDPAFSIQWPIAEPIMVERDRNYPDFASLLVE